jgi:hypothetical protein
MIESNKPFYSTGLLAITSREKSVPQNILANWISLVRW